MKSLINHSQLKVVFLVTIAFVTGHSTYAQRFTQYVQSDTLLSFSWDTENPYKTGVKLTNNGSNQADFHIRINNTLFRSIDELCLFITGLPDELPNEPLERKVWRFLIDRKFDFVPLSHRTWVEDPVIFLNSLGFGYCRNFSVIYSEIMKNFGYEVRTWGLASHAVPEVKINGRWVIYDPTYRVYYYTGEGLLAGVEDIKENSQIVLHPKIRFSTAFDQAYSYNLSQEYMLAALFNDEPGVNKNLLSVLQFSLPPNAHIEFMGIYEWSLINPYNYSVASHGDVKLTIPNNFRGGLSLPLVLHTINGVALISIDDVKYRTDSQLFHDFLNAREDYIYSIRIDSIISPTIEFVLLINPRLINLQKQNQVFLTGQYLDSLSVESVLLDDNQQVYHSQVTTEISHTLQDSIEWTLTGRRYWTASDTVFYPASRALSDYGITDESPTLKSVRFRNNSGISKPENINIQLKAEELIEVPVNTMIVPKGRLKASLSESILEGNIEYRIDTNSDWLPLDSVNFNVNAGYRDVCIGYTPIFQKTSQIVQVVEGQLSTVVFEMRKIEPFLSIAQAKEDSLWEAVISGLNFETCRDSFITYKLLSHPAWICLDTLSGVLNGIPNSKDVGIHLIEIELKDRYNNIVKNTISFEVIHTNHPPSFFEVPPIIHAVEDEKFETILRSNDVDSEIYGDKIYYRLVSGPSWLTIDSITGALSGVPRIQNLIPSSVTIVAYDQNNAFSNITIDVKVKHINHTPSITTDSLPDAFEGSLFISQINAIDIDTLVGDYLSFSLGSDIPSPAWLSINSSTGILRGTPTAYDVGIYNVQVFVTDEFGLNSTRIYSITVNHVNHNPIFEDVIVRSAKVDTMYELYLSANDPDAIIFGDRISYDLARAPNWLKIDRTTGYISGVPNNSDIGTDSVQVKSFDDKGGVAEIGFEIPVLRSYRMPNPVILMMPLVKDTIMLFKETNSMDPRFSKLRFNWSTSHDPDEMDTIHYSIHILGNNLDTVISGICDTFVDFNKFTFSESGNYFWYVSVYDGAYVVNSNDTSVFYTSKRVSGFFYDSLPTEFRLYQNYPNPFNPSTTFRFQINEVSDVRLDIYNMLGQRVETILNQRLQAQYHELDWQNKHLASGIYIAKIDVKGVHSGKRHSKSIKILFMK